MSQSNPHRMGIESMRCDSAQPCEMICPCWQLVKWTGEKKTQEHYQWFWPFFNRFCTDWIQSKTFAKHIILYCQWAKSSFGFFSDMQSGQGRLYTPSWDKQQPPYWSREETLKTHTWLHLFFIWFCSKLLRGSAAKQSFIVLYVQWQ